MKTYHLYSFILIASTYLLWGCTEENEPSSHPEKTVFWEDNTESVGQYNAVTFRAGNIPDVNYIIGEVNVYGFLGAGILDRQAQSIYVLTGSETVLKTTRHFASFDTVRALPPGEIFSHGSPYDIPQAAFFDNGKLYVQQIRRIVRFSVTGNDFDTLYVSSYDANGNQSLVDTVGSFGMAKGENSNDLYWATKNKIFRGNTDGTKKPVRVLDLADTVFGDINDLALWKNKLYIATTKGLWTAAADGSEVPQRIFVAETTPRKNVVNVAIDPALDEVYWFCTFPTGTGQTIEKDYLYRGKLNGSGSKKILENRSGRLLTVY